MVCPISKLLLEGFQDFFFFFFFPFVEVDLKKPFENTWNSTS